MLENALKKDYYLESYKEWFLEQFSINIHMNSDTVNKISFVQPKTCRPLLKKRRNDWVTWLFIAVFLREKGICKAPAIKNLSWMTDCDWSVVSEIKLGDPSIPFYLLRNLKGRENWKDIISI